ncbi:hypothetical protein GQ53DRAFT_751289 [Thozetella sp. PMI_491]|nr:hypothetical protein GQ53DRAFT_751289 [Thozetella sp. PMI_491]
MKIELIPGGRGLVPILCLIAWHILFSGAQALTPSLPLPTRLVYQLPLGTWIENMYVQPSGDILVTTMAPNASVYLIANPDSNSASATLVHTFDGIGGVLGITETEPDVFAVVGGTTSGPGAPVNGTFGVWALDLRRGPLSASVRRITAMPEAGLLNGIDKLPGSPIVLIADSTLGLVWRVNVHTGDYAVAIRDDSMAIPSTAPLPIGINGIRLHQGYLYWTSSFLKSIYRVRISCEGEREPGAVASLVSSYNNTQMLDDLFFGPGDRETIWTPTNIDNLLLAMDSVTGKATLVDGAPSALTVAGGTACAFGRKDRDHEILYVVTAGANGAPVNGTVTEGAKMVAVDTRGYFSHKDSRRFAKTQSHTFQR